jgi:hypothetical protein
MGPRVARRVSASSNSSQSGSSAASASSSSKSDAGPAASESASSAKLDTSSIMSDDESEQVTRCICSENTDGEGFMVACDQCGVWQHGACIGAQSCCPNIKLISPGLLHIIGFKSEENVPEKYFCERCHPNDPVHVKRREALRSSASNSVLLCDMLLIFHTCLCFCFFAQPSKAPATPVKPVSAKRKRTDEDVENGSQAKSKAKSDSTERAPLADLSANSSAQPAQKTPGQHL